VLDLLTTSQEDVSIRRLFYIAVPRSSLRTTKADNPTKYAKHTKARHETGLSGVGAKERAVFRVISSVSWFQMLFKERTQPGGLPDGEAA
jgi:hypothetical protein